MTEGTARIFVLCGEAGTGKTTLCLQTAALLQKGYVRVAGIVSPARFEGERKTGIFVQDIRSGERCLLAVPGNENGLGWRFDPDALQWGSDVLRASAPCDVLVIDELGPLEVKHGKGWMVAWNLLKSRPGPAALVVVRLSLLDLFREHLRRQDVEVIPVTPSSPSPETVSKAIFAAIRGTKR